jgi:X-X-X-Leu-X-X-Gly heptad repeat protein
MSLLNMNSAIANPLKAKTFAAAAPAQSLPLSATDTVGSSAANPFALPANAQHVSFGLGSQPQYISSDGNVYQYDETNGNKLQYKGVNNTKKSMTLTFTGQNKLSNRVVDHEYSRKQVGTERYQIGTEKYVSGYKNEQVGTEQYQTGTEQYQTGTEQVQTGTKQVQTGTELVKTGTKQVQTGTEKYQTGTEKYQTGTEQVQTGTKQVQTGTEQVQTGTELYQTGTEQVQTGTKQVQTGTEQVQTGTELYQTGTEQVQTGTKQVQSGTERYQTGTERVQTGTQQVQTGTEKYQTGTEQYQSGTERVQTGTKISDYTTKIEKGRIDVNRELDGKANAGAVGDIIDGGTSQLMDANKAASFFNSPVAEQYKVSGLTSENNTSQGEHADILKKTDADDMYVAGDPVVGGKGNNYDPKTITPGTGYLTMFEDGTDNGRKTTINAHVDTINQEDKTAFTEYGFVVQDDDGQKTTATLSGGQLKIDGQVLLPGQEKVIGDPNDPVARFYYAAMPGGENGSEEQRLVFESFEKVTPETRQQLIDKGANPAEVDAMRSKTQATFGFRIPDGEGSFRSSAGVEGGLSETTNGVKTYYDAHFSEPDSKSLETTKYHKEPIYSPVYTDKPVYEERPTFGERPVYTDEPVYEECPTYGERPVYTDEPVYEERPTFGERPVYTCKPMYTDEPVYEERPTFGERPVYTCKPVYTDEPVYEERPTFCERPIYGERPVYKEEPVYCQRPVYKQEPVYTDKPVYSERPKYSERPVYKQTPVYSARPKYGERPVYQEVCKPVYGTDYGIDVDYGKSYDKPSHCYKPTSHKHHGSNKKESKGSGKSVSRKSNGFTGLDFSS